MVSWDLLCYGWVRSNLYTDVDIKIEACGVCGSDVHTISGRKIMNEQTWSQLTSFRWMGRSEVPVVRGTR